MKRLNSENKFRESITLLKKYYPDHSNDLFTNWIFAQTAYRAKRFGLSEQYYRIALQISPNDHVLKLDFAKSLVNSGDFGNASKLLNEYTAADINNPEAWLYLAMIDNWKGEPVKAVKLLDNLIVHLPGYQPAKKLREEIHDDISPWIQLGTTYSSDDQPMKIMDPEVTAGLYRNHFLGLDFKIETPFSIKDPVHFFAIGISAGNNFHLPGVNMNLYVNAGLFDHTSLNSLSWTGRLKVEKIFFRKLHIWAEAKRMPYYSTTGSLSLPLFENHLTAAAVILLLYRTMVPQ